MDGRTESFTIEGIIGRGGSAVVYAARDGDEEIAIKALLPDVAATEADEKRFLEEARHLARVRHPGVIAVRGAGTLPDGRPFIAMERLRGETLAARLTRGALPCAQALPLFAALAAGVSALHDEGLLHRDIKPENVFLREETGQPVLLDLGIARQASTAPGTTTAAGVVRGTPATMAPERFFGAPASEASEVYELALLLYATLAGALPWGDATDADARLHARPLDEACPELPSELSDAVMAALSTRIERRPRSVRELAERIAAAAAEPSSAAPVGEPRRTAALLWRAHTAPVAEEASSRVPVTESLARPGVDASPTPAVPQRPPRASRARSAALAAGAIALLAFGLRAASRGAHPPAPPGTIETARAVAASSAALTASATASSTPLPSSQTANLAPGASTSTSASAAPSTSAAASAAPSGKPATPSDPLTPCRAIAALYCAPALHADTDCAVRKANVEANEKADAEKRAFEGRLCAAALPRIRAEVKAKLDRLAGQPAMVLGSVPDAELDARFPGCARYRLQLCTRQGRDSAMCQNIVQYIERSARGSPAQQQQLRGLCSVDALQERDIEEASPRAATTEKKP